MNFQEHTCFWMDVATRRITRYYNRRLAEFGITYNHYFILTILWEKEGVNVKDLCRHLFLDSSSLTGHLDRMERAGLVVRNADPKDRRAIRVYLTEKGKELQEKLAPIGRELKGLIQKGVPKEALRAFQEGLVHIHRRIE
ncbi:MAG: MarR family transcriptional regulator [candidate division NC10 bacterium]|nr:MarR family transcriptional regulator [candidate division NC10 bacterium]